jgi:WD40 repeat protein
MKELLPFAVLYEEDGLGPISHVAFSSGGLLAIGGCGAEVWDLSGQEIPDEPLAYFPGASLPPIAWSLNGERLAIGQKSSIAVYSIVTQEKVSVHEHDGEAKVIAWSPDGTSLISCSEYQQCHVWQHHTGSLVKKHTFTLAPNFLLWLPDQRIATNPFQLTKKTAFKSSKWQVQLWKDEQGEIEHLLDDGERRCDEYTCATFALDPGRLLLGTEEGNVQIWRIEKGADPERTSVFPFHVKAISGLAWSPDNQHLASGSEDGHVGVWDEQGNILYHIGYRPSRDMGVRDIAWWRDLLAVAYDGGHIGLYRVPEIGSSHV